MVVLVEAVKQEPTLVPALTSSRYSYEHFGMLGSVGIAYTRIILFMLFGSRGTCTDRTNT